MVSDVGDCPSVIDGDRMIGIDVGLEKFLTTSDGEFIDNPRYFKKNLDRIAESDVDLSKRKLEKRTKTSTYKRLRLLQQRRHKRVTNLRTEYLYKVARDLVSRHDFIAIEDLNIKAMRDHLNPVEGETEEEKEKRIKENMKKSRLSLSIADAAWYKFRTILVNKAAEAGVRVIAVNPEYTSQICSECGLKTKKKLSDRVHRCGGCGLEIDRDINAAKNILNRALIGLVQINAGKEAKQAKILV